LKQCSRSFKDEKERWAMYCEDARTKIANICLEIAETTASVALERGYEIAKEPIKNGVYKCRDTRKELAADLLLEARSLWVWSNRIGSERTEDPSLVRSSREDLRNASMFRVGEAMRLIVDALIKDEGMIPELDKIPIPLDLVKKGFEDADEIVPKKILKIKPEKDPEMLMNKAAYYCGLAMSYVVKKADVDENLQKKFVRLKLAYNVAAPFTFGTLLYASYLASKIGLNGLIASIFGIVAVMEILRLMSSYIDKIEMKIRWIGKPDPYVKEGISWE
jgi:hypothetical protein